MNVGEPEWVRAYNGNVALIREYGKQIGSSSGAIQAVIDQIRNRRYQRIDKRWLEEQVRKAMVSLSSTADSGIMSSPTVFSAIFGNGPS